jgi:2-dehydropantoate 2-reductase
LARWKGFGVMTRTEEVRTFFGASNGTSASHSVVLLSVSSTALYADGGRWLDDLFAAMPSDSGGATLVMLQPGLDDREYVLGKLGAQRASQLVQGGITLVAYHAPLPGGAPYGGRSPEALPEPGMAYWLPPGQPAMFAGEAGRVQTVRAALEAGGFATRTSPDLQKENIVGMPALNVLVCALEASHWSFEELLNGPNLEIASCAVRESVAVFARLRGVSMPATPAWLFSRPATIRLILHGSKYVVPFDFETYLKVHFTKVGEQMHQGLRDFIRHGAELGVPTPALQKLLGQLPAH